MQCRTNEMKYRQIAFHFHVMCVLYKIFFPKGSGHNSFDILRTTDEIVPTYSYVHIRTQQNIVNHDTILFSPEHFQRIA